MSACPKRTSQAAPHMSAFMGKADMTIWACLLLRSLLGVKRTCLFAMHMSAFDPKRTSAVKGRVTLVFDLRSVRRQVLRYSPNRQSEHSFHKTHRHRRVYPPLAPPRGAFCTWQAAA